jgi:putative heme iron utilization protein
MNPPQASTLLHILRTQQIAALGTLHESKPLVSMVPYATLPDGTGFVIHVSQLAAHTKDMLLSPAVSLLVMAPPAPEVPAQATARISIQGQARPWKDSTDGYAEAKAAYLARFPQSAEMFSFGDFSLFVIQPSSARFVAGFAQAMTLTPEVLADALRKV